MRIAIAGKGGTGKTTISGILARVLGREGRRVLAVDCDTNPNLASVLGMREVGPAPFRALDRSLVERVEEPDGTRRLALKRPLDQVLEEYAVAGPDGVRLMVIEAVGHAGAG